MELGEGVEGVHAVFAVGGEVAADVAEGVGAGEGAEAAADLLAGFDHADVAFGEVVVERDATGGWINTTGSTPDAPQKCLDATGYGNTNGTLIQQYTCTGAPNQLFWVELW